VHTGACRISLAGLTPRSITGRYYTDRFTAGDMELSLISRSTEHSTFGEAAASDTVNS
jgi:hypothetical protein